MSLAYAQRFSKLLFGLLVSLTLFDCQLSTAPTSRPTLSPPVCAEPGIVLPATINPPTRGYAYNFQIYLPPCYAIETERRYPILYLIPGRGGGPESWFNAGVAQVADELILNGEVPAFIIVTTQSIDGEPNADTILNDLLPYVESQYRLQTDRQHRAVAGGSLGGIGAYRLALHYPAQFASLGMFGSGLVSGEETQVQTWLQAIPPELQPRVFLNCGEGDPLMLERAQALEKLLTEVDITPTWVVGAGDHSYGYWVSNLPTYFHWLAQDW